MESSFKFGSRFLTGSVALCALPSGTAYSLCWPFLFEATVMTACCSSFSAGFFQAFLAPELRLLILLAAGAGELMELGCGVHCQVRLLLV